MHIDIIQTGHFRLSWKQSITKVIKLEGNPSKYELGLSENIGDAYKQFFMISRVIL